MKDRTEKESIDPLSSITGALTKYDKTETAFIRVDFTPLVDTSWRENGPKKIIESHMIPNFLKAFLLSYWWFFRIIAFPFQILTRFIILLLPPKHDEPHEDDHKKDSHSVETRFDSFGYGTRILIGVSTEKDSTTRDIAASFSIYSAPK